MAKRSSESRQRDRLLYGTLGFEDSGQVRAARESEAARIKAEKERLEEERKAEEAEWEKIRQAEGKPLAPDSPFLRKPVKSLDAPKEDLGYDPLMDIGVSAHQGASSVTKGAIGLPINLANLAAVISNPVKSGQFITSLLKGEPRAGGLLQQPEIVRGVRQAIDDRQQRIYDQQASDKLKQKSLDFQETDGVWNTTKFLATNPGFLGLQGVQQAPQLLAGGGAPGITGKVLAGALSAASQTEEASAKILRDAGHSEEEIASRSSAAFASSLALNAALPFAAKATFLEGLVSGVAGNRVTSGVIKDVLDKTSREIVEGVATEVGDQFIQNVTAKRPLNEGLAQAGVMGAFFSGAVAGPAATLQSAAEAGKAASKLQGYLNDQTATKQAATKLQEEWATARKGQAPLIQLDMFGGGGQQTTSEPAPRGSAIGTDSEGNQEMLRTRAAVIQTQLEQDRTRLQAFQDRIDRAPFTEGQEDTLTKGERTDMSRLQERIGLQEGALARVNAVITPTQPGLGLAPTAQPDKPAFTGEERTVEQVKSDYFKTQPVQGPQNMTTAQRKAVQKDILEETKRTKAEEKKAADKVKATRAAARRKFLDGQRAGLLDLPVEERAKRLAEAGREWDTANPLVLPTAPVATKPAAASAEAQEAEASVPVSTLTEGLQGTPEGTVALPSAAPRADTGVSLDDVRKAVGGGKRDKLASRLSYMVQDGNLEIVQDQADIKGLENMKQQGKGWYDSKSGKTYIVAGNLDSKNVRGDLLSTLAHETKHAGDFGGSKPLARSFKSFIGAKANTALAEKIKAAAKSDPSAAYAVKRVSGGEYTSLGLNSDQTNSEIVANYISAESKKGGITTSLYRGVVSPIRAGARKLLRSNEVSLGDISYMADKLVGEVAARGERMTGVADGKALPMFVGPKAKTAPLGNKIEAESRLARNEDPELVRRSTGWHRGAEGKMRFEISDHESSVTDAFRQKQPGTKRMLLKDALVHDELFKAYPWLKLISITRDPGGSPTIEGWAGNLEINVTPTAKDPQSTLLHEVQHIIQEQEKWAPGGAQSTVYQNMSNEQRAAELPKVIRKVTEKAEDAIRSAERFDALRAVPRKVISILVADRKREKEMYTQTQKVIEAGYSYNSAEYRAVYDGWKAFSDRIDEDKAAVLAQAGLTPTIENKVTLNQIMNGEDATEARDTWNSIALREQNKKAALESGDETAIVNALKEADALYQFYKRLAGEVESRTTQYRQKLTPKERMEQSPQSSLDEQYNETKVGEEIVVPREGDSNEESSGFMPSLAEEQSDNRSWWNKQKDNSAGVRVLDDVLSTTGGFGIDLFKIFDQRQGLRGDLSLRAEAIFDKADKALKSVSKNRRISSKALSSEIETKLAEINKNPNRDEREAAVRQLDEDYPGVGTALSELRDLKWSLARGVIQQRAAQGGELTTKEQNIFGAIIKNAETYTTRAYLSNQVNAKSFAKQRLKDMKKNPEGEDAAKFEQALDFITRRHLAVPTREELNEMKGAEVRRFYEQWIGESTNVKVEDMADQLAALPSKSTENQRAEAMKIAEELMGLRRSTTATARSYGGSRQNRTILEGRENVPDEIRFLMGEITNPVATEMMSIARLINLYTQTKMLQDMVSIGKDKFYKDSKDGDFNILLKSETYGPMKGKWVTPTASKFLEPAVSISLNIEQALSSTSKDMGALVAKLMDSGTAALRATTGAVKMVDLITSPAAMAWNYLGAYVIMGQNGVLNPALAGKAQRATWRAIRAHNDPSKFKPEELEEIQELVRSRVLDSATVGEFQQSLYENMFRMLENEQSESDVTRAIGRAVKDGSMQMRDAYAFMDMWAKVAAYYDRRDYLTKFYTAEGSTKTAREIELEAGQDITAANISYTRAFNIVKKAERTIPMFTMYLTYFSEVPRSLVASSFLAVSDFKRAASATTPEGKDLAFDTGMRRAAGTFAATAVITALVANALEGLSDDEKRRRETDPEWEQKGIPVPVGTTKDGKAVTINILRADPNGPMNEFMVRLASMDKDEDVGEVMLATLKSQFVQAKPVMATFRLIKGLAGYETKNFEDDHGELANWLDDRSWGDDKNLGRNFMSVLEGFTPRIVKGTYRSLNDTIGNRQHEFDSSKNTGIVVLQSMGATPNVRDPEFSLELSASAYNKKKKDTTSKLNKIKDRFPRLNGNQLIDQLAPIVEGEEEAFRKLWKVYDGTKAFNGYYTDKDYADAAKSVIKDKKLGAVGTDLENNAFNVRFISDKYLKEWRTARETANKEIKDPTEKSVAAAALRKEYKLVTDYLSAREEENK